MMSLSQPETIATRLQRWCDFFSGADTPKHMFIIRSPETSDPRPLPQADNMQQRIDWAWRHYERQLARLTWLDDDVVPHLDPYTGTELFAEAFGCQVHYPEDNMPHALPRISTASEVAKLQVPGLDTPALARVFQIADALYARAGGEAVMRLADIQSPMGISALIWDKSDFYPSLLEAPEAVRELAEKVKQLLFAFLDEFFARYGRAFIAHCPEYYLPNGVTLSDDEVGVVSPALYRELFLPDLRELSTRYGAIGIHCCANAVQHWPAFKTIPNLKLLNLREQDARPAYACFAGGPTAQMHGGLGSWEDCETLLRDFPTARFVFDVYTPDRTTAQNLSERLAIATGRLSL